MFTVWMTAAVAGWEGAASRESSEETEEAEWAGECAMKAEDGEKGIEEIRSVGH